VGTSWFKEVKQFKSPLCVVAEFLLRSRETQAERARKRAQAIQQLRKTLAQQPADCDKQCEGLAGEDRQISRLKAERRQLRTQPPTLPDDPPLPGHEFGPKMISLCVNLARRTGLRVVPDVLKNDLRLVGAGSQNCQLDDGSHRDAIDHYQCHVARCTWSGTKSSRPERREKISSITATNITARNHT